MKLTACKQVTTVPDLNLTEYVRASWYSQIQQTVTYQTEKQLFCVVATYNIEPKRTVPFFDGTVISVYNSAVNNNTTGIPENTNDKQVLCARVPDENIPSKLEVAGPYWIIAIGKNVMNRYDWTIVSGGQPTHQYPDGCTTGSKGYSGTGLWFFTREIRRRNYCS